ncbi:ABC transporter permease [soil metagenome]|jgi:osmoprotectant transport system permease protein|nr:ABC transporter permease [Chloroflexia bacterium]
MDLLRDVLQYAMDNQGRLQDALGVHLRLSLYALSIAMAIFIPLGVLASRSRRIGPPLVALVAAARVVPSLALLFLMLPLLGTGFRPALVALTILAGPPLIVNTDAAMRNVNAFVLESARGLGMNPLQVFAKVHLPLSLPVIVTGVRSATIDIIASATLAAFIGAGGLGTFILSGLTLRDTRLLLVGAIPVIALALTAEAILNGVERLVTPPAT